MGNKKNGKKKLERASVSRERRLALALRAVLDAGVDIGTNVEGAKDSYAEAEEYATLVLSDLGYGSLVGIPKRLKELGEQLTAAVAAGDGKRIAELGLELERAKAGKEPGKSTAPTAGKKSSTKSGPKDSTANTETLAASAGTAGGE